MTTHIYSCPNCGRPIEADRYHEARSFEEAPGWQVAVRARLFTFGLHYDIPLFFGSFPRLCAPNDSLFFGF